MLIIINLNSVSNSLFIRNKILTYICKQQLNKYFLKLQIKIIFDEVKSVNDLLGKFIRLIRHIVN